MSAVTVDPTTELPDTPVVSDVLVVEGVRKTFEAENAPVRAWRIARQVPPVAVLAVAEVGADRGASTGTDYGPDGGSR